MKINILEARNQLSKLIQSALDGEEVVIANRGNPVVRLVPIENPGSSVAEMSFGDWLEANPLPAHLQATATEIDNAINEQRGVLIYAVELHPVYGGVTHRAIRSSDSKFAISPLVKMECLVQPLMRGNVELKKRYEAAFEQLIALPMPEDIYLDATLLRARFKLKTPDALHLSCAQHHQCKALWTNDNRFSTAGHGLTVNIFSD